MLSPAGSYSSESYRIPKDRVAVSIALRGGEPEDMSVFLGHRAAHHPGRERPSELLYNEEQFLTVVAGDESVRFINKASIAWMTVAPELEMSGRCETETHLASGRCRPIDITLDDGRVFVGEVAIMLPDANSRLQDFLNSAGRFFEVRDENAYHFVNRDRVVIVKATE